MTRATRVAVLVLLAFAIVSCRDVGCRKTPTTGAAADPAAPGTGPSGRPHVDAHDLGWLVANSPLVFVGTLASQRAERDDQGRVITRNVFTVADRIIGAGSGEITLTTFGGTLGDETVSASHVPEFVSGMTYVVFTDPSRTSYTPTTGGDAGVFLVVSSAVYSYDGAGLSGIRDGRLRFDAGALDTIPGPWTRDRLTEMSTNPVVSGSLTGVRQSREAAVPALQLAEFTRLIVAARR